MADSFLTCVRGNDTIARLGGDEFVIVLNDLDIDFNIEQIIERLITTCSKVYKACFIIKIEEFFAS